MTESTTGPGQHEEPYDPTNYVVFLGQHMTAKKHEFMEILNDDIERHTFIVEYLTGLFQKYNAIPSMEDDPIDARLFDVLDTFMRILDVEIKILADRFEVPVTFTPETYGPKED